MTKKEYIESKITALLHKWTSIAMLIGSLVIISLSLLDYLVTPMNFKTFLLYRVIAATAIFSLYLINRKKINKIRHHILAMAAAVIVSTMVALMIARFGGHQSLYFAGIILIAFFVVGLTSLDIRMSVISSSIIYAIYLIPILSYDTISNSPFFINANVFILLTLFTTIFLRYLIQQRFVSEFSLEYDLSQEKKQLKKYSQQLEDMVAQKTKELSISEQWHRSVFDNATDGIIVMDKDGKILNVNQKVCELHGFEKDRLVGTNIRLLESAENKEIFEERMSRILNGESLIFETDHYRKDGSKVSLEVSSKLIDIGGESYIQSFYRDITEKKRIQEQLFQSQKMESIGLLAGGIAHDFNNILTAILGNAELLHNYSSLDAISLQKVKNIEKASQKAGQMVARLLSFARKDSLEMQPLSLNDVINDTIDLIGKMMVNKKIDIKMEIESSIPPINGNSNQLEQAIMNLILNASDAMPDGGVITIKTSLAELQKGATHIHPLLPPGIYIVLKISDTGKGIPDEIKGRIFDPFFTTKEPGKGTGLGLAMVYGIVKRHGGVINVESLLGKGTTFEIYLPASDKAVYRVEKPSIYPVGGGENILVVDDEPDVLSFIRETLERQGYRVIATDNPVYGLSIFKQLSENIDLVIVDIVMPLVNGRELIRHFKIIKSKVKIIAISGYNALMIERKDKEVDAFIRKPFEGIYLLSVIRRVLDMGVLTE